MRTAITEGKTHEGKWEVIAGRDVPVLTQRDAFRMRRLQKADATYAQVTYQESDGHLMTLQFRKSESDVVYASKQNQRKQKQF